MSRPWLTAVSVFFLSTPCARAAATPTATATSTVSLTASDTLTPSAAIPTDTHTATSTDIAWDNHTLTLSNDEFYEGEDLRIRVDAVLWQGPDTILAPGFDVADDDAVALRVYAVNESNGWSCEAYAAHDPLHSFSDYGVPRGAGPALSESVFFTFTAPAADTEWLLCMKHTQRPYYTGAAGAGFDEWAVLTPAGLWAAEAPPPAKWLFRSRPAGLVYEPVVHATTRKFAPIVLSSTEGGWDFSVAASRCGGAESGVACAAGDAVKLVRKGDPCAGSDDRATARSTRPYPGSHLVDTQGAWSAEGLARCQEHSTVPGGFARLGPGRYSTPFHSDWPAQAVAKEGSPAAGVVTAYVQLPVEPGEYEVCFSARARRAAAKAALLGDVSMDSLPLWRKVYAAGFHRALHFSVRNETMTWRMFDLTPHSTGIIQFFGFDLRRNIPGSPFPDPFPAADAYRITDASHQYTATAMVQPGCFGTTLRIGDTGFEFDGAADLTGDPTDDRDTATVGNTSFGVGYVGAEGARYMVCYRRNGEQGGFRVLRAERGAEGHGVLGGLAEGYAWEWELVPGAPAGAKKLTPDSGFVTWEVAGGVNVTRAEMTLDVRVTSHRTGGNVDSSSWKDGKGAALRIVRYDSPCDAPWVPSDVASRNASESTDAGTGGCVDLYQRTTRPESCPGRSFDGASAAVTFSVTAPLHYADDDARWDGAARYRVCVRQGWGNWVAPPREGAANVSTAGEDLGLGVSERWAAPLYLRERPGVALRAWEDRAGMEAAFVLVDPGGGLATSDTLIAVPKYHVVELGDYVTVTGAPQPGEDVWWTHVGAVGYVWQTDPDRGLRLRFGEGYRNGWFPLSSVARTPTECLLDGAHEFFPALADEDLQPYCETPGGRGTPGGSGLMHSGTCSETPAVREFAAAHYMALEAAAAATDDVLDDIVPWDSDEAGLTGAVAALVLPEPSAAGDLAFCYKKLDTGWLRLDVDGLADYKSTAFSMSVRPSPEDTIFAPLQGGSHAAFAVAPAVGSGVTRLLAKFVLSRPGTANDNCLAPPAGTRTNCTASSVWAQAATAFTILVPEAEARYWLCVQPQAAAGRGATKSWLRRGPYRVVASGVSWASGDEFVNTGVARISLRRYDGGVFDTNPGGDKAKLVRQADACHDGTLPVEGPSAPVAPVAEDLGPGDGPNGEADFAVTLPASPGDLPAVFKVCVHTKLQATAAAAWVEASSPTRILRTQPARVRSFAVDPQLQPRYALRRAGAVAMAGASTVLRNRTAGVALSFWDSALALGRGGIARAAELAEFKLVRVGGPAQPAPEAPSGAGWAWAVEPSGSGCLAAAAAPLAPCAAACAGGNFTGEDDAFAGRSVEFLRYAMRLTLPQPGAYAVCFRWSAADPWLRVPSEHGEGVYLETLPVFLEYSRELEHNVSVLDVRSTGDREHYPTPSWCVSGGYCADLVRLAPQAEVCEPPPDDWLGPYTAGSAGAPLGGSDAAARKAATAPGYPWARLASFDAAAPAAHVARGDLNLFLFPPPGYAEYTPLQLCLYKSGEYSADPLTGSFDETRFQREYVAKAGVVYTLWNAGKPENGGGSLYWWGGDSELSVEVSSPTHDIDAMAASGVEVESGEVVTVVIRTLKGVTPVVLTGVAQLIPCGDAACREAAAPPAFSVQVTTGCSGATAAEYSWPSAGLRQVFSPEGTGMFSFAFATACPAAGCFFRLSAAAGGETAISPVFRLLLVRRPAETVAVNGVPACAKSTVGCAVVVECFHDEPCGVEVAAMAGGRRLRAVAGVGFDLVVAAGLEDFADFGLERRGNYTWDSSGQRAVEFDPALLPAVRERRCALHVELPAGGGPPLTAAFVLRVSRRAPAAAKIAAVNVIDDGDPSPRRAPAPVWIPALGSSSAFAAPAAILTSAEGSHLVSGVAYELVYYLYDASGGVLSSSVTDADAWRVSLSIAAHASTRISGPNGTDLVDLPAEAAVSDPRAELRPASHPADAAWSVRFRVRGALGCSRLNDNRAAATAAKGQGCDIRLSVSDPLMQAQAAATLRTPVRLPATTLRVFLAGEDPFNPPLGSSDTLSVSTPLRTGLPITVVPGSYHAGIFVNDEYHHGGIFALMDGSDGISNGNVRVADAADGVPARHSPVTMTWGTGEDIAGLWAASWTLRVTEPCAGCGFSLHSDAGGGPDGRHGWLNATFTDGTIGVACAVTPQTVQWYQDSGDSETFTVTVFPVDASGQNTRWPRWLAFANGETGVQPNSLRLVDPQSREGVLQARMQGAAGADASATFSFVATGPPPKVATSVTADFTAETDFGVLHACRASFALQPLLSTNVSSMRVTRVGGAAALCEGCVGAEACGGGCTLWQTDTERGKALSFEVTFWNTTSAATERDFRNFNVTVFQQGSSRFPFWNCDDVSGNATCTAASPFYPKIRYPPVRGASETGVPSTYTFGTYGRLSFSKTTVHGHSAPGGVGIITLRVANPEPARDVSFDVCASTGGFFEAAVTPGCLSIRLWVTPAGSPAVSVAPLRLSASNRRDPTSHQVTLAPGGVVGAQTCGHQHSVVYLSCLLYYTIRGVRYIAYDRPVNVTISRYPRVFLVADGGVAGASALSTSHSVAVERTLLSEGSAALVAAFSLLHPVDAARFVVSAAFTDGGKPAAAAAFESEKVYAAAHRPQTYTALRVRGSVSAAPECPTPTALASAVNGYVAAASLPASGWAFASGALAGVPFPMQLYVDTPGGERAWSHPATTAVLEKVPSTSGCGDGGAFTVLEPKALSSELHKVDDFVEVESIRIVGGVGVAWVVFSDPCEACAVRATLCAPGAGGSAAACTTPGQSYPSGPPAGERSRVSDTFSVARAVPSAVLVTGQTLPTPVSSPTPTTPVIEVAQRFKIATAAFAVFNGAWALPADAGSTRHPYRVWAFSKWSPPSVLSAALGKYGNGGFLSPSAGVPSEACGAAPAAFGAAARFAAAAAGGGELAFAFTRSCDRCEVWVYYEVGGASGSFPLRSHPADDGVLVYGVRACGVLWLPVGTLPPAVLARRPFSLAAWLVDENGVPAWGDGGGELPTVVVPDPGLGGNGGGGTWRAMTLLQDGRVAASFGGAAHAKLVASRACYSCTVVFAARTHNLTVLAPPAQLVVIPSPGTHLAQVVTSAEEVSTWEFTLYAADEYKDRSYLVSGPSPLAWHSSTPAVTGVTLSVTPPGRAQLFPWRTDDPADPAVLTIASGACMLNGAAHDAVCGGAAAPGTVVLTATGGTMLGHPLSFELSDGTVVPTLAWGGAPAVLTRTVAVVEIDVDDSSVIAVHPGVPLSVPVYAFGRISAENASSAWCPASGAAGAAVTFDCAGCSGCTMAPQTVAFTDGVGSFTAEVRNASAASGGVCVGTVRGTDGVAASEKNVTYTVARTPRASWAFASSANLEVEAPAAQEDKYAYALREVLVTVVLKAYTWYYTADDVGGYVDWPVAGVAGSEFATAPRTVMTFTVARTPRVSWAFASSANLEVEAPAAQEDKYAYALREVLVTVVLKAYTRYYTADDVGGYVDWPDAGVAGSEFATAPFGCWVTAAAGLNEHGTVITVNGTLTASPCRVTALARGPWSVLPESTSLTQTLTLEGVHVVAWEVVPSTFGSVHGLIAPGTAVAGKPVSVVLRTVDEEGQTCLSDYSTVFTVTATRPSDALAVEAVSRAAAVRRGTAVLAFTFNQSTDGSAFGPWALSFSAALPPQIAPRTRAPAPAAATQVLRVVSVPEFLAVEYRSVPVYTPETADPTESPMAAAGWQLLGVDAPWRFGHVYQLRVTVYDSATSPPMLYNASGVLALTPIDLPCASADADTRWLSRTCLPTYPDREFAASLQPGPPCSTRSVAPCAPSTWLACAAVSADPLPAAAAGALHPPTFPLVPGDTVELPIAGGGFVAAAVTEVRAGTGTADLAVAAGNGSTTAAGGVSLAELHRPGCLVRGAQPVPFGAARVDGGAAVFSAAAYVGPRAGAAKFEVRLDSSGAAGGLARTVSVVVQVPAGVRVAKISRSGTGLVLYEAHPSLDACTADNACEAPFDAIEAGVALDIETVILTRADEVVTSDNFTRIAVSSVCLNDSTDGFRLGKLGGASGLQVENPPGWNISTAASGVVTFSRLAFFGACGEAAVNFACPDVAADPHGICARLRLSSDAFEVAPSRDDFSSPVYDLLPPPPPVAQPSLVLNMGTIDIHAYTAEDEATMEATLTTSIRHESRYPEDIKRSILLHLCTVRSQRANLGLNGTDRVNPAVCRKGYDAAGREGAYLTVEDCGGGCSVLAEFAVVVLNPADAALVDDVFSATRRVLANASSPLRKRYQIPEPAAALVSTAQPDTSALPPASGPFFAPFDSQPRTPADIYSLSPIDHAWTASPGLALVALCMTFFLFAAGG
ncbi:hypothetical protein DIPPA_22590 [Diplonema papillatum]|nr:hypothetical protein DIPPA_22590 [Diplonema papillatum]